MLNEKQLYWIKFIIYVGTAILTPWATLFSGSSAQDIANMGWHNWMGVAISDIITGLIAARAFLDTTAGRIAENKDWEEWENDVKSEVKNRLNTTVPVSGNSEAENVK